MVIPLRTIFYGIPILIVGVLAALPFRRAPEPESAEGIEQPAAAEEWAIEPIRELSAAEFAAWDDNRPSDHIDPMQSLAESMPPIADSYQAVTVPSDRPAKIAERFSAVAHEDGISPKRREPLQPLAGYPATLASTGIPRSTDVAGPNAGWNTGIPIGRPSKQAMHDDAAASDQLADQRDGGSRERRFETAPPEATSTLPAPRARQIQSPNQNKNSRSSQEPWPTLAELARKKQTNEDAPHVSEPNEPTNPSERSEDEEHSATSGVTPASSFSGLAPKLPSIRGTSDEPKTDQERFFIREPVSDRG